MGNCKTMSKGRENLIVTAILAVSLVFVSTGAMAAADEMGDGICKLVGQLTGKWLFGFTILATLGAGAALLFGAEMTDGLKKLATIISVVGLVLGMSQILTLAFSTFATHAC